MNPFQCPNCEARFNYGLTPKGDPYWYCEVCDLTYSYEELREFDSAIADLMVGRYILKDRKPVVATNLLEWGMWFEDPKNRIVAQDDFKTGACEVHVSTAFLGVDHGFREYRKPILFETMAFGGEFDGNIERYASWDAAQAGHERWCAKVREAMK